MPMIHPLMKSLRVFFLLVMIKGYVSEYSQYSLRVDDNCSLVKKRWICDFLTVVTRGEVELKEKDDVEASEVNVTVFAFWLIF